MESDTILSQCPLRIGELLGCMEEHPHWTEMYEKLSIPHFKIDI